MLLEGIETLLVLSKAKTMSRTGSLLYISQSAVSKRIANLERKLGKKLIEPSGRQIKLTPDAIALVESIGPAFNELRGLIYEQQELEDTTLITLDSSKSLIAGYLGEMMGQFIKQDKHITITTNHTPRIIERVQSGKATLGLCAGLLPPHHGLMTFHLFDEPFYIVSKQSLTALPPLVITNDMTNPANSYQLSVLAKFDIKPLMEMDAYTAAAQLALGGAGPALIPLSIVKTLNIESQYLYSFPELAGLIRPIHICVRPNSYHSPRVKTVIESIVDAVPKAV
ncbi:MULTISPECIES: LysR family transcriptional regulator [Vibrio]|jgi:DNA-binding transcriptional LysR family regulator|uniref:LysR family transcriptional regulator n=1 Tax=Vibrio kanaloae TaxID=170673 RepID=A0A2N7JB96_9VIBR|nr:MULTISPECIES: LysR family transcriptional regulator [Vibrio]KAB0463264.1 LysR family transcriptional regulator [Vibrio kanaloae]MCG9556874.1 LysR family transcriptional regulator [Vibrio kanaloae]NOI01245.1 LysR family transcriptional regulator [Vibrio kanaloae]OEF12122.1 transcriptional regulator [Vibrio kanaloae 5S-149]PMM04063.1 transcriptional regulator [Vibrio kanaloae]